ncbi:MAG: hypothetical protein JSS20_09810 [Proteobacteria bacterium]|nr:hypothetical protein [Pseudomonadota bacterium]
MRESESSGLLGPLIVRAHAAPWGFVIALPLAAAFTYLGARALDAGLPSLRLAFLDDPPQSLLGVALLTFALLLFSVGIGELARWLKPHVMLAIDQRGITSFSLRGEQRLAWTDILDMEALPDGIRLQSRDRRRGVLRSLHVRFDRLAVEPRELIRRIHAHRPDLAGAIVASE